MKSLHATLVLSSAILAASLSLAAETPFGISPGGSAAAPAAGSPAGDVLPELEALRAPYLRNVASFRAARDTRVAGITSSYVTSLERLQKETAARGDLEGALQVKAEMERIAGGQEPSANERKAMPAALVAVRRQYENERGPILASARQQEEQQTKVYLVALDTPQKRLTTQNQLEKALLVKAERGKFASGTDKPVASTAAQATPGDPEPGSPEAAAQNLERRLTGTSWSFPPKKSWVRFEKDGHLYVGWAKSAFGKWKVTGDHLVEFSPWTNGRKEILKLNSSLRTGTITSADGQSEKTERTDR